MLAHVRQLDDAARPAPISSLSSIQLLARLVGAG
jgi:hypothetical protein